MSIQVCKAEDHAFNSKQPLLRIVNILTVPIVGMFHYLSYKEHQKLIKAQEARTDNDSNISILTE